MKTLAHTSLRIAHKTLAFLLAFCIVNLPVWAIDGASIESLQNAVLDNPIDPGVNTTLNILDSRAIIDWNNMDTVQDELLRFQQAGGNDLTSSFAVLNRISGGQTQFDGILQGGLGHIFVINPSGVILGSTADISAGRFTASTMGLDMLDGAFLDTNNDIVMSFKGNTNAAIELEAGATIEAQRVDLLAQQISNAGNIVTGADGVVVMAAGDSVYLGEPGGKVIVEMTSVADGSGSVLNAGTVESDGGTIIMAAGDIYSVPLHPQLEVGDIEKSPIDYDYSDTDDKAVIDDQPTRAETGTGAVVQSGSIDVGTGEVVLTAGDSVTLADGSTTSAVDGSVTTYAYDFGDKGATTSFNDGAVINIGTGTAGINGNHILYDGTLNADAGATLEVDPVTLTIADGAIPENPALDTLYEQMVEAYSQDGINLDLAADDLITVDYMTDGEILGGNGDITLRNVFDTGGIYFADIDGVRTTLRTTAVPGNGAGGTIEMIAGSAGIVAGDLVTDTQQNDKISQPGEILLLTTNGGDIEVDSMLALGANNTQVSAIADGDLTVYGDAESINKQVDNDNETVSKATLCLIAEGDIILLGDSYQVYSHGKTNTTADVRISAGGSVTIGSAGDPATIYAQAKTSQQNNVINSTAYVVIHAGRNVPGTITINGEEYTSGQAYLSTGDISAKAWPDLQQGVDSSDTPSSSSGTETIWEDTADPAENFFVKIEIDSSEEIPIDNELSPCYDCPRPEGLPPVPHIFWIVDDSETMSWSAMDYLLDVLTNDDNGSPLVDGSVSEFTTVSGGTLTPVYDAGDIVGFEYTPPADAVFVVSDLDPTVALYVDSFTYRAYDSEGNESLNTATVSLTVTNFLPTASGDSATIHMNDTADFDLITGGLITDIDGTPGVLNITKTDPTTGTSSLSSSTEPSTATYTPYDGFVGDDSFDYTVLDSSIQYSETPEDATATLSVTVENALPTFGGDLGDVHMNTPVPGIDLLSYAEDTDGDTLYVLVDGDPVELDDFLSGNNIDAAEIVYDGANWNYTPADGYVGAESFTVVVWDGQYEYENGVQGDKVTGSGDLTVNMTNTLPTFGGDLGDVHMNTPVPGIDLLSYAEDTDGDTLYVLINGVPVALANFISGNNIDAAQIVYDGANWTYTPTDGYVGAESFTVIVWDGQYDYVDGVQGDKVTGSGDLTVNMTNTLPTGTVILEDASMNAVDEELAVVSGDFTDADDDDFAIADISPATDDENLGFGGDLSYNGAEDPYVSGDSYTYSADPLLPGYTGEDNSDVQLWDGQYDYVKIEEGPAPEGYEFFSEGDGYTVYRAKVYGTGSIELEVTNELPGGDAWFGQVHMDSQNVSLEDLANAFGEDVTVESGTYTGEVIGSDLYGGTLVYDGTTWTYSTDTDLPGYVGDENDQYGDPCYLADDLFTVNLSGELGDQFDYWFSDDPAPEGYEYYEPADLYRKAEFGTGTLSVDITNELPTIDTETTVEHMNEDITEKLFAQDHLDGNPVNELDGLAVVVNDSPDFGSLTLIDNGDGTYSYTLDPADGYVGDDSFDVTVWDGQRDYVFGDGGEILSDDPVTVQGTVSMEFTNILPSGSGNLGVVEDGVPVPQNDVTSPVTVTDPLDAPQQDILDNLQIVPGVYMGSNGGTLVFNGSEWIYTPAPGFTGEETFAINVWDGQKDYSGEVPVPVYGEGSVTLTIEEEPDILPVAPLPLLELPKIAGCPVEMDAVALELGVNSDEFQVMIADAMATNPSLQPCDACQTLLTSAANLRDPDGARMAALAQIFNTLAPADAPFTPEVQASVATAFADMAENDPQYAMAAEYVDAFAAYVAVLEEDLKSPVGDPVALVLEKYGEGVTGSDNPNIAAYIAAQMGGGSL